MIEMFCKILGLLLVQQTRIAGRIEREKLIIAPLTPFSDAGGDILS